jgi:hypothetical protein
MWSMSARSITCPFAYFEAVVQLVTPLIRALQAELDAADWCCHSHNIRESLEQAWGEAKEGRPAEVLRHLKYARYKLDLEWWWWSRGGSDFPPDRPAGERRPAVEWLSLDDSCCPHVLKIEAGGEGKSSGTLSTIERSDSGAGSGFPEKLT